MKKLFFDQPNLVPVKGRKNAWKLTHTWNIYFRGESYVVPIHTETDGASIPRALWILCGHPMETPRLYAALLHDYLYGGGDPEATRADADDLFRDLQIALGVPRWKAYVEWAALRLCGKSHWYKAVLAAVALAALSGCIEIAHVDSFVTVPKDAVSFGVSNQTVKEN